MKEQFLSSNKSSLCKQLSEDKIELLVCKTGTQNCKEPLSVINKFYVESHCYRLEKDYLNSIESLKCAFLRTCDLEEDTCVKCAEFFRSTITKSLENINGELQRLTSGIIGNNRYMLSYQRSTDFLNDIRKKQ